MTLSKSVIDFFFPPQCLNCRAKVEHFGDFCAACWSNIDFITNPICPCCGVPNDFDLTTVNSMVCYDCSVRKPSFNQIRSLAIYGDVMKKLILQFKHGDATYLAPTFAKWLTLRFIDQFEMADIITTVPIHWLRLFKRQYNQATLIAKESVKDLGFERKLFHVLGRKRGAVTQGHKKRAERFENMRQAFFVDPSKVNDVNRKSVLIIDDVVTTGATIDACSKVLLEAGAKSVNALTVARVLKSSHLP